VFLGKMTIAPRLVLQAIRLDGVDRGRISVPSTTRRHCFASLPALLLQPRTVIAPIALFVGAMVTPRLILQSPSVFWVDDRIECPHHRLQAVGRGRASDSDRDGADRPDKANHNRAHIALQRVLGLSHGWDNGRAVAFFHPSPCGCGLRPAAGGGSHVAAAHRDQKDKPIHLAGLLFACPHRRE
jgi:hypothetical protein